MSDEVEPGPGDRCAECDAHLVRRELRSEAISGAPRQPPSEVVYLCPNGHNYLGGPPVKRDE